MGQPRAGRTIAIGVASAAIHICLLSALAIEVTRPSPIGSPEPAAIQVTLERLPEPAPTPEQKTLATPRKAMPGPGARQAAREAAPAPIVAPTSTPAAPEVDASEKAAMGSLVRALRGSVGCSNPDAVSLTPAEREACQRQLHAGLEEAKPISGIGPKQQAIFDAGAKRDTWWQQPFLAETPTNGCRPRATERAPPRGGGQEWKGAVTCAVPF